MRFQKKCVFLPFDILGLSANFFGNGNKQTKNGFPKKQNETKNNKYFYNSMEKSITRRTFIRNAVFGTGLLIYGKPSVFAHKNGSEYRIDFQTFDERVSIAADNPSIQFYDNRCMLCGDCAEFCRTKMTVYKQVAAVPDEEVCIRCGQCTIVCPEHALTEKYHYQAVAEAIADPDKITVASIAPAVRVALGEMYGLTPGTNVEGQIVGALKQAGIDYVLDATVSADLIVMEEATELMQRLEAKDSKRPLPMFTSCCPAWVRFVQLFYPALMPHLSTAKSPAMAQGALVKTYFARKMDIDPEKIVHIALMPCTAKKAEILWDEMNAAGISHGKPTMRDVDIALTCREIASLLKSQNVDFLQAQDAPYSSLMGSGSGAGIIFGNTGGVMEATLRTAYKLLNGENSYIEFLDLQTVRGSDNLRQANVELGKHKLNVAVVNGVANVRPLIEEIQNGVHKFDFVEVMACPGGCIGGGGQPITRNINATELKQLRINALYQKDATHTIRLSCDNPEIKAIYDDFLGQPLGTKSVELLHRER